MKNNKKIALIYIVIITLGRLIPHPPNFTPLTNLCLFGGLNFPRRYAILLTLTTIAISDALLAVMYNYPIFSYWTLFTYSGLAAIVLVSSCLKAAPKNSTLLIYLISSGLGFWLWTNFGVWLTSNMYAKNITGLLYCYIAALPFLRNAMLGDLTWMCVIFGSYKFIMENHNSLLYLQRQKPNTR